MKQSIFSGCILYKSADKFIRVSRDLWLDYFTFKILLFFFKFFFVKSFHEKVIGKIVPQTSFPMEANDDADTTVESWEKSDLENSDEESGSNEESESNEMN